MSTLASVNALAGAPAVLSLPPVTPAVDPKPSAEAQTSSVAQGVQTLAAPPRSSDTSGAGQNNNPNSSGYGPDGSPSDDSTSRRTLVDVRV